MPDPCPTDADARLRDLVAHIPAVLCQAIHRANGTVGFSWVDDQARERLGLDPAELIADWRRLPFAPEDWNGWIAAFPRALARRSAWTFEGRCRGTGTGWSGIRLVLEPRLPVNDEVLFDGLITGSVMKTSLRVERSANERRFRDLIEGSIQSVVIHRGFKRVFANRPHADVADRYAGHRGTLTDITERRAAQPMERQRRKMEALGLLAGGVAHEINNLLQPIITFARFGREKATHDPEMQDYLATVLDSARKAADVVAGILAFARTDVPVQHSVTFADEVSRAIALVRRVTPTSVEIRTTIADDAGHVAASGTEIFQVLNNLVANAVHAMNGRGAIDIRLERVPLLPDDAEAIGLRAGEHFHLMVADSGKGMDSHTLDRIFDPFFTTKPVRQGSGLGLSIVYRLVSGWNGTIIVSSIPGKGTSFTLFAPIV